LPFNDYVFEWIVNHFIIHFIEMAEKRIGSGLAGKATKNHIFA